MIAVHLRREHKSRPSRRDIRLAKQAELIVILDRIEADAVAATEAVVKAQLRAAEKVARAERGSFIKRMRATGATLKDIARTFGISPTTVRRVCTP